MLSNKGFSLVEIIVSVALLLIISTVFLTSMVSHYGWLVDTKTNVTQDSFTAQETIESNISAIKRILLEENEISGDDFDELGIQEEIDNLYLFNTTFGTASYPHRAIPKIYQTEAAIGDNRKFIALVGSERLEDMPVPTVSIEKMVLVRNGGEANPSDNYEYNNYAEVTLYAIAELIDNPDNCFFQNKHEWYVSQPGFLLPYPEDGAGEDDLGLLYPIYPTNVEPLPINNIPEINAGFGSSLNHNRVKQYPGRFIIYTVTPYALSLKMGTTARSAPVYIMGPGYTENLYLHLDASTVCLDEGVDGLNTWKNLRPSTGAPIADLNAKATVESGEDSPIFVTTKYFGDRPVIPFQSEDNLDNASVWGRALGQFQDQEEPGNKTIMKIGNGFELSTSDGFDIFLVMRAVEAPEPPTPDSEKPLLFAKNTNDGESWSLQWIGEENNPLLSLNIKDNEPVEFVTSLALNEWYVIQISVSDNNAMLKAYNLHQSFGQAELEYNVSFDVANLDTNGLEVQWNGVQIAELLVYNEKLDNDSINKVVEFIIDNKYNPGN